MLSIMSSLFFSVSAALPAEGIKLGTTRIARLVGPPQERKAFVSGPKYRRRT